MDKPYSFAKGGMEQTVAEDVASRIEAMGFEATIQVDDYDQFQVYAQTPEERQRFRSFAEYKAWFEHWCDTHMSGGG